jgi:PTS system ascorbate-specific IIC component
MGIINFITGQILSNAGILFGILALTGLLILKRPIQEVVTGVTKTIIGYLIIVAGAGMVSDICTPIASWISTILSVEGVQPSQWPVMSIGMSKFGSEVGLCFLFAFILNLLLARFTPLKGVNVTGHLMLFTVAWIVPFVAGFGYSGKALVLVATIICGLQFWLGTTFIYPFMKKRITSDYSLGMLDLSSIAITSWISPIIGDPNKTCNDIEVPDSLSWIRDSIVLIGVMGAIIWLIIGLLAGQQAVQKFAVDTNWIIYLLMLGVKFSAGIAIILYGVRMLIAEIVPALNGLTDKLIPGAILGLDFPTVFNFAPTAVFIGFFFKLIGAIIGTVCMIAMGLPVVILPSVFNDFWDGAIIGVFADRFGGRRAAILVPLILGIVIQFGWALVFPISGKLFTGAGALMDYADNAFFGPIIAFVLRIFTGS